MDIYPEFKRLVAALSGQGIPFALCGGLALAVYGVSRATIDIDLLVREDDLEEIRRLAGKLGFTHSPGKMTFRNGTIEIVRLVKFDREEGDELILDLLLVTPALQKIWEKREKRSLDWGEFGVVSREGLIGLKELRGSGTDRDDIGRLRGEADES